MYFDEFIQLIIIWKS